MSSTVNISERSIFQTYSRLPVAMARGEGVRLWDEDGREYLDFLSGIAVCNLGHCHPAVVQAAREQLGTLMHVSNFFYTRPQAEVAEMLARHSFADRSFFCNSGAEANEAAIKLARKFAGEQSDGRRFEIITMQYSFHGRTLATLTATGQEKIQKGFAPLLPGFRYVAFNDMAALREAVTERTCAVMLEPIQGEGGVNLPAATYLQEVRELCSREGVLLIFDEVQVGMGRTGKLFAYENYGVEPDIMTLAKALAGGLPAGAMLATERVAQSFSAGSHASTFGGNPVVMAAALAVMKEMTAGGVLENCRRMGDYFIERLRELQAAHPGLISDVRGKGLMIGMEVAADGPEIVQRCLDRGLIINCTLGRVLRFVPALVVAREDIDRCVSVLDDILKNL